MTDKGANAKVSRRSQGLLRMATKQDTSNKKQDHGCSISSKLAIKLGLESAVGLATDMITEFNTTYGQAYEDVPEDQFVAVALFEAALRMKLRPPKKELVKASRLKSVGFNLLLQQMKSCCTESVASSPKKNSKTSDHKKVEMKKSKKKPAKKEEMEIDEDFNSDMEAESEEKEDEEEDYETWKQGMLQKAFIKMKGETPSKYKEFLKKYAKSIPEGTLPK